MREDIKINIAIILLLILVAFSIHFLLKRDSKKQLNEILITKQELEAIAEKMQLYYKLYNQYPKTLSEKPFSESLKNNSIIDPFSSNHDSYILKRVENKILLYSVGPNKKDDGGTLNSPNSNELLDITVIIEPKKGSLILNEEP